MFPVKSLGSEKPAAPMAGELAEWIHTSIGRPADLTTWEVETTLRLQLPAVTTSAAGGIFYRDRLLSTLHNISGTQITGEFDPDLNEMLEDCRRTEKISRHCWWSIPAPSALGLEDAYFADREEAADALSTAVRKICRIQRDAGAAGHILTATAAPGEIEQEMFTGKRYLWQVPATALENILEIQRDLVLPNDAVCRLEDLTHSYTIRSVLVADPTEAVLKEVCTLFDPEDVTACGTAPASGQKTYWERLSYLSIPKSP